MGSGRLAELAREMIMMSGEISCFGLCVCILVFYVFCFNQCFLLISKN